MHFPYCLLSSIIARTQRLLSLKVAASSSMGIPRLAKQLHAFSEFSALGCKTNGCEEHPCNKKIIIDGPSLAYHIYRCGLAVSPSSIGIVDAIPSYDGLGQATLAFLDELQCHGATV